jgi:hypothetical protein
MFRSWIPANSQIASGQPFVKQFHLTFNGPTLKPRPATVGRGLSGYVIRRWKGMSR